MNRIALFQAFLSLLLAMADAQPGTPGTNNNQYPYARLSPSMAIVIVVLIAAFFIMGFFSVYIRHCSNPSSGGLVRRALSRRGASRGLDPSVLQTFPTFTYSEVRDHKIGKGALECAVCLNEFEPDDTLRLIPKCDHVFHMECIDAWLESHVTCPVCRADLVPDPDHVSDTASTAPPQLPAEDHLETRSGSDQIAVQVDEVSSSPARSASLRIAKVVFGFGRFRSHSTGHSVGVVQPEKNLERFTLRLPEQVRKDVMDRALLNRSAVPIFPRGESSRSSRWRSYWRIEREAKSDRWLFFSRGRSVRSPKVVAEAGEASGAGGPTPIKMPPFKFPERKAADDTGLFSPELDSHSPV